MRGSEEVRSHFVLGLPDSSDVGSGASAVEYPPLEQGCEDEDHEDDRKQQQQSEDDDDVSAAMHSHRASEVRMSIDDSVPSSLTSREKD